MTITAQRLLTELGNKAWSGYNSDDMVWDSEDSLSAKAELNSALRYLINREDFPFRAKEQPIMAISGISNYNPPIGQIASIYNTDTRETLLFVGDGSKYDKTATGEPSAYWIDYNNPNSKIRLYPIPDKTYNFNIVYNQFKPVKDTDGTLKFEFTKEDDFINMPSTLEFLFMDCLVLMTMAQNNKDEQDENYRPTLNEFEERWRVFKKAAKPSKITARVVW